MENKPKRPTPGRSGDPRMNRAVAARLQNPKISVFDALRAGGFHWTGGDSETQNDIEQIFDSDGVSLSQRRNQLNRRLRYYKRKDSTAVSKRKRPETLDLLQCTSQKKMKQTHSLQSSISSCSSNDEAASGSYAAQASCIHQSSENLHHISSTCKEIQHSIQEKEGKYSHSFHTYDPNIDDKSSFKQCSITSSSSNNDDAPRAVPRGYNNDVAVEFTFPSFVETSVVKEIDHDDDERIDDDSTFDPCAVFGPNKDTENEDEKIKMAFDRFHVKNSILLKKCLLMAGIPAEQNIESSTMFQDFAEHAAEFLAKQA